MSFILTEYYLLNYNLDLYSKVNHVFVFSKRMSLGYQWHVSILHHKPFRWLRGLARIGLYKEASFSDVPPLSYNCCIWNLKLSDRSQPWATWRTCCRKRTSWRKGRSSTWGTALSFLFVSEMVGKNYRWFLNFLKQTASKCPLKTIISYKWYFSVLKIGKQLLADVSLSMYCFFLKAGGADPHSRRQPSAPCAFQQCE